MPSLVDMTVTPPTAHYTSRACAVIRGMSVPVANPPNALGIYLAGPDDPVPAGQRATAWTYVVLDLNADNLAEPVWRAVRVPTCEAIPLAELKTARIEALAAEADTRYESRWHVTDRVLSTAGEALTPASPAAADDAKAHNDARDAAITAVEAATDAAQVAAVEAVWPE